MHIVIFTGGESPAPCDTEAYFSSRAPDYVIAADAGVAALERYNAHFGADFFCPQAILGDMDSLSDASLLQHYPQHIVQTFVQDKDYTDTELALAKAHQVAAERGQTETHITLVGAGGGARVDHLLAVFDLFATDLRPDVWLCENQALWYAPAGAAFSVSGLGLRDVVSVARTTAMRTGGAVRSKGLLWEYDHFRAEGMPSISNRIHPDFYARGESVTLSVQAGEFVLIVPVGAKVCVTLPAQRK